MSRQYTTATFTGAYYDKRSRDWVYCFSGDAWEDSDGNVRHFLTGAEANDAAEREIYGPLRAERQRRAKG
jgi:hypothetical protein